MMYTSVGCQFGLNSTPLKLSAELSNATSLGLSACRDECYFLTPEGENEPWKIDPNDTTLCTHFNYSPSDNPKCTMFNQFVATGTNFAATGPEENTCGFLQGWSNQPAV